MRNEPHQQVRVGPSSLPPLVPCGTHLDLEYVWYGDEDKPQLSDHMTVLVVSPMEAFLLLLQGRQV